MIEIKPRLSGFHRDSRGSVLPMVAVGSILLMALVGSGVDISRAYKTKARLQAACDAGVLAGRRTVTTAGYDQASQDAADNYFNVNYDEDKQGTRETDFDSSSTDNGKTVDGTASTTMDLLIMKVFGHEAMDISVDCTATMGIGNADVMMVLDTTGSMLWQANGSTSVDPKKGQTSRLQDLQVAMRNFYQTLADASEGTNARIRYGFVPYAQSVNVGRLLPPEYIRDSWDIQSREPLWTEKTKQEFDKWSDAVRTYGSDTQSLTGTSLTQYSSTDYTKKSTCENNMPNNGQWQNDGNWVEQNPSVSENSTTRITTYSKYEPQKRLVYTCQSYKSGKTTYYRIYYYYEKRRSYSYSYDNQTAIYKTIKWYEFNRWNYKKISYDVSEYKGFNSVLIPDPTLTKDDRQDVKQWAASRVWPGCIEERETSNSSSFSFSTIFGMSPDVADLDIDSAPDSEATKWAPMWPDVVFYRTGSSSSSSISNVNESQYGRSADFGCPYEAQALQVMTQDEFNGYVNSLSAEGGTYHDIGMTWGARLISPDGIFSSIVNDPPDNGGNVARHIIFMTDGELATNNYIQSSWGIEMHDKRVTSDGSDSQSNTRHRSRFLALCEAVKAKGIRLWVIAFGTSLTTDLQTCASSNSSYPASNPTQLDTAFQEIAKQVGELRMTQ